MRTSRLPIVRASAANICQHQGGLQVNKFEQVFSLGNQML